MQNAFIDTETCGLHGPPVTIQYSFDDAPARIHHVWLQPVRDTLRLIERIVESRVVAHNLAFDWFKLQRTYNMLCQLPSGRAPIHQIEAMADAEINAWQGPCLKPYGAICTLTLAQKNLGGVGLAAKAIYVRRVPKALAQRLCDLLEEKTSLPDILFAKRKSRWSVRDNEDAGPGWADVVLSFGPSNALKDICRHVLGVDVVGWDESGAGALTWPTERGYCPIARHLDRGDWNFDKGLLWPALIHQHVSHWFYDTDAKRYAISDIDLLRKLYVHFGSPTEDFDADLIAQVASVRNRGFRLDMAALDKQIEVSSKVVETARLNVDSPKQVRDFVAEALDPMERIIVARSGAKEVLDKIEKTFTLDEAEECCDDPNCKRCGGEGTVGPGPMPVVERVHHILEIRKHTKRLQTYRKWKSAKRAYPSFKVVGTKSGRMSGTDGLNWHAIDASEEVRSIVRLHEEDEVLSGGDYSSQELALAASAYNDDVLLDDLKQGKSLHGLMAAAVFEAPYEEIMATKDWRYKTAKIIVYAILYGASDMKIAKTIGCSVEEAHGKIAAFFKKYASSKVTRDRLTNLLTSMRVEEGGRIEYTEPTEQSVKSIFGFERSFEIENEVIRQLIDVMPELHDVFGNEKAQYERKENKVQTATGCIYSAMFGAVMSLQGSIIRAALNHLIQSSGRTITLGLQHDLWKLQPCGIRPWRICLMSVHDEIAAASKPEDAPVILSVVQNKLRDQCKTVPLLVLDWATNLNHWYDLKHAEGIRCGFGENE
jgi:hypothetical protein